MAVEVDRRVEPLVDVRLMRRLVVLELGELDVPAPPGVAAQSHSLFVRVLPEPEHRIRVELWEHGSLRGTRLLVEGSGEPSELGARRIALAAAALGRQLRTRRLAEARAQAQADLERAEREEQAARDAEARRVHLSVALRGALVGPGDSAFIGVTAEPQLQLSGGARLGLLMSGFHGRSGKLNPSSSIEWLEIGLAPEQSFSLRRGWELSLGIEAALAAVHLERVVAVDDIAGQRDTWSARTSARARVSFPVQTLGRVVVGPDLGWVLRPIPVVEGNLQRVRLGGAWLGLAMGILF